MMNSKSLMVLIAAVSVSIGQSIKISGVVKDSATGTALAGAVVQLSRHTYVDTTDTSGNFKLQGDVTSTTAQYLGSDLFPLKVGIGNQLEFKSSRAQRIHAAAVNLRGRTVAAVYDGIVAPGNYTIPAPILSAGYYLYVVKTGDSRHAMPFVVAGGVEVKKGISGCAGKSLLPEEEQKVSKSGLRSSSESGGIVDTIIVSAAGYYQRRIPVTAAVISGLEINCWKYADSVIDIDGNVYHTVIISTQTWMVENLKTTKYNDGTAIPLVQDSAAWAKLNTPGYCWYNNDSTAYKKTYGALYNWYAAGTGKLAPTGWHIPTDTEWNTLKSFLGVDSLAGGKLKETGFAHWISPNAGATNETGFSALPGGYRNAGGPYAGIGGYGTWWSSTESSATSSWTRNLYYYNAFVDRASPFKKYGFSVRCIRD